MAISRGSDMLLALRDLTAYDKDGKIMGKIHGGTSNRKPSELWTEDNAEAFVDDAEVPLKDIYFSGEEVNKKISALENKINSIKSELIDEKRIPRIKLHGKEMV